MADKWFTADNHFGHANILQHCRRPWENVFDMDEGMIEVWNRYVRRRDTVYVLGDFLWDSHAGVATSLMRKLHGNLVMLKGNHDRWFKTDKRYMHTAKIDKIKIWMCHYPLRTWPNGINLHGHTHGTLRPVMYNQFDVGVDTNPEYRPYHWEEIKHLVNQEHLDRKYRP